MSRFFSLLLLATGWCVTSGTILAESSIDFNRDVLPILSDKCFHCHGPDASKREADLRFDVPDVPIETGVIIPGDPDASEVVFRIYEEDPDELMPPPKSNRKLTEPQKEILRQWIVEGAEYEQHWAFVPPVLPELPVVSDTNWARTSIDRFVQAKLEAEGLKPSPLAEPETWMRRVHLDLLGLPPRPKTSTIFSKTWRLMARLPMSVRLTKYSNQTILENVWRSTGSMSPAMRIPTALTTIRLVPCGVGGIG